MKGGKAHTAIHHPPAAKPVCKQGNRSGLHQAEPGNAGLRSAELGPYVTPWHDIQGPVCFGASPSTAMRWHRVSFIHFQLLIVTIPISAIKPKGMAQGYFSLPNFSPTCERPKAAKKWCLRCLSLFLRRAGGLNPSFSWYCCWHWPILESRDVLSNAVLRAKVTAYQDKVIWSRQGIDFA